MFQAALLTLLTQTIAPEVVALLHTELANGSPVNLAVKAVLAQLESAIPNPIVRAVATDVLNSLVTVIEKTAAGALPAAPAAS